MHLTQYGCNLPPILCLDDEALNHFHMLAVQHVSGCTSFAQAVRSGVMVATVTAVLRIRIRGPREVCRVTDGGEQSSFNAPHLDMLTVLICLSSCLSFHHNPPPPPTP